MKIILIQLVVLLSSVGSLLANHDETSDYLHHHGIEEVDESHASKKHPHKGAHSKHDIKHEILNDHGIAPEFLLLAALYPDDPLVSKMTVDLVDQLAIIENMEKGNDTRVLDIIGGILGGNKKEEPKEEGVEEGNQEAGSSESEKPAQDYESDRQRPEGRPSKSDRRPEVHQSKRPPKQSSQYRPSRPSTDKGSSKPKDDYRPSRPKEEYRPQKPKEEYRPQKPKQEYRPSKTPDYQQNSNKSNRPSKPSTGKDRYPAPSRPTYSDRPSSSVTYKNVRPSPPSARQPPKYTKPSSDVPPGYPPPPPTDDSPQLTDASQLENMPQFPFNMIRGSYGPYDPISSYLMSYQPAYPEPSYGDDYTRGLNSLAPLPFYANPLFSYIMYPPPIGYPLEYPRRIRF